MNRYETIAAIATAPGRGGVAIVRVSGPAAFAVAQTLTGKKPTPGKIAFARMTAADGALLDEGVVLAFQAPHSYTGEDVIEFQTHGGTVTPQRILEACIAAGARLARRGEFTERAFLNGRMSLDQAQAVVDLIDAKTTRAADWALASLDGANDHSDPVLHELYNAAVTLSATVEHALDVSEEDLPPEFASHLKTSLDLLQSAVRGKLAALRQQKFLREGVLVVLAGEPNVGKSSLLNALLQENRAIVSDIPGTTRDAIEAWLDLDGWPVRLVDTAGLRATADVIEAEGVRRTENLLARANVIVRLATTPTVATASNEIAVLSKADLVPAAARAEVLAVSVKTGEGLADLRRALLARLDALAASATEADADDILQRQATLVSVETLLAQAPVADLVLFGNCLRRVCESLGRLVQAVYSEDLLSSLFARFCVGK